MKDFSSGPGCTKGCIGGCGPVAPLKPHTGRGATMPAPRRAEALPATALLPRYVEPKTSTKAVQVLPLALRRSRSQRWLARYSTRSAAAARSAGGKVVMLFCPRCRCCAQRCRRTAVERRGSLEAREAERREAGAGATGRASCLSRAGGRSWPQEPRQTKLSSSLP